MTLSIPRDRHRCWFQHVPPFRQIGLQTGPAGVVGGAVVTAAAVVVSVVVVVAVVCVVVGVGSWVGATSMVYTNKVNTEKPKLKAVACSPIYMHHIVIPR